MIFPHIVGKFMYAEYELIEKNQLFPFFLRLQSV